MEGDTEAQTRTDLGTKKGDGKEGQGPGDAGRGPRRMKGAQRCERKCWERQKVPHAEGQMEAGGEMVVEGDRQP